MTKRRWQWLMVISITLLIGGGGVLAWRLWPRERNYITDARNIRRPAETVQVRDILWDEPVAADELLALTHGATDYAFDADRQRLVYVQGTGTDADIYQRLRSGNDWSKPIKLDTVNSTHIERDVALSPDGKTLLFASDRPGVLGGFDLFVCRRDGDRWLEPELLAHANSDADDLSPTLAINNRVYFSSNRRGTVEDRTDSRGDANKTVANEKPSPVTSLPSFDLYVTTLKSTTPAVAIEDANSTASELGPCLSPVGDFLYFASDRDTGLGGFDIYRMRILVDGFGVVEPLDDTINSSSNELDPHLGLAGFELTYRSMDGADDAVAKAKLYRAVSREVFRDVTFERGTIDWAALWRQIGPNLLWAAFALLLSLLFLALIRDFRDRQVSLLARCLALSLFVHLLLMLAFNLLKVTTTLASSLGKQSGMHVTLTSTANAGEIGQQVRGAFVETPTFEFEMPTEAAPQLASVEVALPECREFTPAESSAQPNESSQLVADFEMVTTTVSSDVADSRPAPSDPVMPMPQTMTNMAMALDIQTPTVQLATNIAEALLEPTLAAPDSDTMSAPAPTFASNATDIDTSISRIEPAVSSSVTEVFATNQAPIQTVDVKSPSATDLSQPSVASSQETMPNPPTTTTFAIADIALPANDPAGDSTTSDADAAVVIAHAMPTDLALPAMPKANSSEWKLVESEIDQRKAAIDETATIDVDPFVSEHQEINTLVIPQSGRAMTTPIAANSFDLTDIKLPGASLQNDADNTSDEPALAVADTSLRQAPSALPAFADLSVEFQDGWTRLQEIEPNADGSWVTENSSPTEAGVSTVDQDSLQTDVNKPATEKALPATTLALALSMPNDETDRQADLQGLGRITGRVVDAEDGSGMARAQVRLTLPEDASVVVEADDTGGYTLDVPEGVPDHFALSASAEGFVPESVNIPRRRVQGQTLTVNFALSRVTELVIALEDEPDVHHLGNDRFEGRINSQFQKRSEGRTYRASFDIKRSQLPPNFSRAEIVMLVKGVQCPHQVRINSRLVDDWLSSSPRDGSFGEYRAAFSPDWLVEGKNRFKIRARSCGGDLDDFEFVNVQIRLLP